MPNIPSCPKCHGLISVPAGADPSARVRCPLCRGEYLLQDALESAPPTLELIDAPAASTVGARAGSSSPAELSVAAGLDDAELSLAPVEEGGVEKSPWSDPLRDEAIAPDVNGRVEWQSPGEFASAQPPADAGRTSDSDAFDFMADEASDLETPLDAADDLFGSGPAAEESETRGFREASADEELDFENFGHSSAESISDESPASTEDEPFTLVGAENTSPSINTGNESEEGASAAVAAGARGRKKSGSPLITVLGIVGGGLSGCVIAYAILLWLVGTDPLQIAPSLPEALVPSKLRVKNGGPSGGAQLVQQDPSASTDTSTDGQDATGDSAADSGSTGDGASSSETASATDGASSAGDAKTGSDPDATPSDLPANVDLANSNSAPATSDPAAGPTAGDSEMPADGEGPPDSAAIKTGRTPSADGASADGASAGGASKDGTQKPDAASADRALPADPITALEPDPSALGTNPAADAPALDQATDKSGKKNTSTSEPFGPDAPAIAPADEPGATESSASDPAKAAVAGKSSDATADQTVDTIADPTADPTASPSTPSDGKGAATALPDASAAPVDPTDPFAPAPTPLADEPLGPKPRPEYDAAALQTAVADAEKTNAAALALPATASQAERNKVNFGYYRNLSLVAERLALSQQPPQESPGAAEQRRAAIARLIAAAAPDKARLEELGKLAGYWYKSPARKEPGILVVGKVAESQQVGKLWRSKVELAGKPVVVTVVSREKLPEADPIVVLGAIVDNPRSELIGYEGEAESVIWSGMALDPANPPR